MCLLLYLYLVALHKFQRPTKEIALEHLICCFLAVTSYVSQYPEGFPQDVDVVRLKDEIEYAESIGLEELFHPLDNASGRSHTAKYQYYLLQFKFA